MGSFKVYFFIYCIMIVIRAVFNFGNPTLWVYGLLTLFDLIGAVGVFGYSFKKLVFNHWVWRILLIPFTLSQAAVVYLSAVGDSWAFLVSVFLLMPAPYALYLYGFKTNWATE